jgi:hypothetical protein
MARRAASHSHAILAPSGAGAEWCGSLGRGREGGPDRAADHLVEDALVGPDRRAEQSEVAVHGDVHGRLVPLPELGAAFNVGEEEGDAQLARRG